MRVSRVVVDVAAEGGEAFPHERHVGFVAEQVVEHPLRPTVEGVEFAECDASSRSSGSAIASQAARSGSGFAAAQ